MTPECLVRSTCRPLPLPLSNSSGPPTGGSGLLVGVLDAGPVVLCVMAEHDLPHHATIVSGGLRQRVIRRYMLDLRCVVRRFCRVLTHAVDGTTLKGRTLPATPRSEYVWLYAREGGPAHPGAR